MKNFRFLDDIVKRLCESLPDNLQQIRNDLEKNFHVVLQNAFSKLDLVTREEFDAQTKVLARSRQIISSLEERLQQIESSIKRNQNNENNDERN